MSNLSSFSSIYIVPPTTQHNITQDEALLQLRGKAEEAAKLQARIATLEAENEALKRDTKKTS